MRTNTSSYRRSSRDILIAALILLAGLLLAGFSFQRILEIERPVKDYGIKITPGYQAFALKQHGRCVGVFSTNYFNFEAPLLGIVGDFALQTRNTANVAKKTPQHQIIVGRMVFNRIGQLLEASLVGQGVTARWQAIVQGPNPLKLEIGVELKDQMSRVLRQGLPGPVMLLPLAGEAVTLHYPAFAGLSMAKYLPQTPTAGAEHRLRSLIERLDLAFLAGSDAKALCPEGVQDGLDISALDAELQALQAFSVGDWLK